MMTQTRSLRWPRRFRSLLAAASAALLVMGTLAAGLPASAAVTYRGKGTQKDPYLVETAEQLNGIRNNLKAHYKLAEMERAGILSSVITQNIDGLHTAAGSKKVLELHGSVHPNYCMDCGKFYTAEEILTSTGIPKCTCGGIIKPDVVLYEEGLDDKTVTEAVREISQCDTLIIAGTSLTVYPAAGMVRYFQGDDLVLINRDKTSMDGSCDLVIHDKVGETLDKIVIK